MLTPIELQGITFKSGMGYAKKSVDAFYEEILLEYEQIYKENIELKDKITVLSEGIQYYKTIEKTLQKALVLAEKTSHDTKQAAVLKASNIENEAYVKADLILADSKKELERLKAQIQALLQQFETYKIQFRQLTAAQTELLNNEMYQLHGSLPAYEAPKVKREEMPENQEKIAMQEESIAEEPSLKDLLKQAEELDADPSAEETAVAMEEDSLEGVSRKIEVGDYIETISSALNSQANTQLQENAVPGNTEFEFMNNEQ